MPLRNGLAMDLAHFMEEVGARVIDVARAAKIDAAIVVRVRDRQQVPSGITMVKLNRWAKGLVKAKRLSPKKMLTWDHLLDDAA